MSLFSKSFRSASDFARFRAARLLDVQGTRIHGAWITPYDFPASINSVSSTAPPTIRAAENTLPGSWYMDTGVSGGSELMRPQISQDSGVANIGFVAGNDSEEWYAAMVFRPSSDTIDAGTELGMVWRNQATAGLQALLGIRASTSTTKLCFWGSSGTALQASANFAADTNYFVEVYRKSSLTYLYIDRVLQASGNVFPSGSAGQAHLPCLWCNHGSARKRANIYGFGFYVSRNVGL